MNRFACALLAALCLAATASADTDMIGYPPMPDGRIVGGQATEISSFPHQISMRYNGRHRCGGSIYSPTIIVSAAHCVVDVDVSRMTIAAGSTLLSDNNVEIAVKQIIMHEDYTSLNDNDVAILVLAAPLSWSQKIQPIALATERPADGAEVTVTGWGTLVEGGAIPDELQKVTVNYVPNATCRRSYPFMITNRMLCAGVTGGGKDACQGDSGGPLINQQNELLGIVSWGIGCARASFPGVYASVPDLRGWIISTVENVTEAY